MGRHKIRAAFQVLPSLFSVVYACYYYRYYVEYNRIKDIPPVRRYDFEEPIMTVQIHPRNDDTILACPLLSSPKLIDTTKGTGKDAMVDILGAAVLKRNEAAAAPINSAGGQRRADASGYIAVFTRKGDKIYTGTPLGEILVYDAVSLEIIKTIVVSTGQYAAIKSITFSRLVSSLSSSVHMIDNLIITNDCFCDDETTLHR